MPSSYTASLRLTLPVTGELPGQWGNTVNLGVTDLLDAAVAGTTTISTWGGAGVPYTLSTTNGATDESRRMFVVATGSPGEAKNIICPSVSKLYFFRNDTAFTLTFKTGIGSGVAVPAGQYRVLYCNGTNVVEAFNSMNSPTFTGTPAAPTAAVDTNSTQIATTAYVVGQGYSKLASPTFTGTPAAPTAAVDTNSTQVATTAYVVGQGYSKLASPTFTGTPAAPTAAVDTSSTQLATTAYVVGQGYLKSTTAASTYLTTSTASSTYFPIAGGTFTGAVRETRVVMPANNIDLSAGNYFLKTISGNTTFTATNTPTGSGITGIILDLTNGGSATITWWASMQWESAVPPTLTVAGRDLLGFIWNGSNWSGYLIGKDVK